MRFAILTLVLLVSLTFEQAQAQGVFDNAYVSGSLQFDGQSYKQDSLIGAQKVDENFLSNTHFNLMYSSNNFNFGLRYEAYLNPTLGIDPRYKGQGLAHRFATYRSELVEFTVGDFYEQFGSGMILRSYQERLLGIDNAIDGVRVRVNPHEAVTVTGLIGRQRNFWEKSEGLLRGGDIKINVNNLFFEPLKYEHEFHLGGSFVSRYEADLNPTLKLPENVMAYSLRASYYAPSFILETEFAHKYNDPNAINSFVYNDGYGLMLSSSYFTGGLAFNLNMHRIDNMDFRSERNAMGEELMVNFVPPLTKQHAFRLPSMFPFATQLKGQVGMQAELGYNFFPGDFLGGKRGMNINVNYSRIHSIDKNKIDDFTYESDFFTIGDELFYQDITLDIEKRITDRFKTNLMFVSQIYNRDVIENEGFPNFGLVNVNSIVLEGMYKLSDRHAIRGELQHLWFAQDSVIKVPDNINGNWLYAFAEYTISPGWFFSLSSEYNYGNDDADRQINYLSGAVTYVHRSTRISMGYGKQRSGITCVGGICRPLPASNGFTLGLMTSF